MAKVDWVHGIRLVERKLRTTLEAQGISPIKAVGEDFDPNLHEAVMHVKGEDGKVVRELQKGYRLHDKILRPSKVAVGNGEPVIEEPAIEPEEETKTGITHSEIITLFKKLQEVFKWEKQLGLI